MTLSPAKLNLIWTAFVNSRVMTGEPPNTKSKYCQCTSAALLCYPNKQIFNCMWRIITYNWWIWIVPFILHCYKTSLSTWWLFLCIWDLVALATKKGSDFRGICKFQWSWRPNNWLIPRPPYTQYSIKTRRYYHLICLVNERASLKRCIGCEYRGQVIQTTKFSFPKRSSQ